MKDAFPLQDPDFDKTLKDHFQEVTSTIDKHHNWWYWNKGCSHWVMAWILGAVAEMKVQHLYRLLTSLSSIEECWAMKLSLST